MCIDEVRHSEVHDSRGLHSRVTRISLGWFPSLLCRDFTGSVFGERASHTAYVPDIVDSASTTVCRQAAAAAAAQAKTTERVTHIRLPLSPVINHKLARRSPGPQLSTLNPQGMPQRGSRSADFRRYPFWFGEYAADMGLTKDILKEKKRFLVSFPIMA